MVLNKNRFSRYAATISRNVGYAFFRWIYPASCLLCESDQVDGLNQVCPECWTSLPRNADTEMDDLWLSREKAGKLHITQFFAFFQFDGGIQEIIHELKYSGRTRLAREIIQFLANDILDMFEKIQFDELIPVPLHSQKLKERGFNQSELITAELSTILNRPVSSRLVKRIRHTQSQTLLKAEERLQNVSEAFEVISANRAVKDKTYLLVDDLITTGSTFNECAAALLKARAKTVYALAIARA